MDFFIEKCINQPLIRGGFCPFLAILGGQKPWSGPGFFGGPARSGAAPDRPGIPENRARTAWVPGDRRRRDGRPPPETAGVGALAAEIGRLAIQVTIKDD